MLRKMGLGMIFRGVRWEGKTGRLINLGREWGLWTEYWTAWELPGSWRSENTHSPEGNADLYSPLSPWSSRIYTPATRAGNKDEEESSMQPRAPNYFKKKTPPRGPAMHQ